MLQSSLLWYFLTVAYGFKYYLLPYYTTDEVVKLILFGIIKVSSKLLEIYKTVKSFLFAS